MSVEVQHIAPARAGAFPRYRFVIAGLILCAHLSIGVNLTPVSPVLPLIIDEYKIPSATASLLVALPMLVKAFIGLPGSVIVSRYGLKRTFALSWFLMGFLALSSFAPNFPTMLMLRFVYGIGAGLMMPAIGPLVMQWFPPREVPIINSIGLIVMSFGIAISVSSAVPLTSVMPWQGVLGVFGLIGLVGAIAWSLLGQTQPEAPGAKAGFVMTDILSVLRDRTILLLVVGDALVFIFYAALTSWLPTHFHEFRGMSLSQAGNITGLLPTVGMVSVLVGGFLTIKIKSKRLFFIIPGILVGLGGFGSFLLEGTLPIIISVAMFGVGTWIYQPMLLTLPMQLPWMTPKKIAVVWGASLTIAGLGMFISPIVVGASRDIFGTFVPGFVIWALLAWALLVAGILLPGRDVDSQA